jgi:hypothetical protein
MPPIRAVLSIGGSTFFAPFSVQLIGADHLLAGDIRFADSFLIVAWEAYIPS